MQDLEIVYRSLDAFKAGDLDAFLTLCNHELEFVPLQAGRTIARRASPS
jgi:ketosteroid isomerase-like protein